MRRAELEVHRRRQSLVRWERFLIGDRHDAGAREPGLAEFEEQVRKRRDAGIPLEQSRNPGRVALRPQIERPHRRRHRMIVRVDEVRPAVGEARQVDLDDMLGGQAIDVYTRVEAVIARADMDVIDVQQQSAAGRLGQGAEEFPFRNRRGLKFQVGARILQHQRPTQDVLNGAHPVRHVRKAFRRQHHGQQVVGVHAIDAGPAEMIGDPGRPQLFCEGSQLSQIDRVQRRRASDRQRHAVHDHRAMGRDPLQHAGGVAPIVEEVLADDLEPVDAPLRWRRLHEMAEVRAAEADAVAQIRQPQARRGPVCRRGRALRHHVDGGNARRSIVGAGGGFGGSIPITFW